MVTNTPGDRVLLQELKIQASVGCGEEAPPTLQQLRLNVAIAFDARMAAVSHRLTDTIDYVKVAASIRELAKEKEWPVIESLGERLCDGILERFPPAHSVRIEMQKFVIPEARWAAVELFRARGDPPA